MVADDTKLQKRIKCWYNLKKKGWYNLKKKGVHQDDICPVCAAAQKTTVT
jgi:hypothetical protein